MLRFLFGRPRTVRVPIDRSNIDVQQVKVTSQSRPVVARFILTCIVTTAVIQGMRRWDPLGTYAKRDVLQEEMDRVKKNVSSEHSSKYGKHWDKQHSQMSGTQPKSTIPGLTDPDAIRITVPIWLRKGHQRMYTASDPEWKEFAKLQGDPKRIDTIRRQIGETVMHQVKQNRRNEFELAVINFTGKVAVALEVVPQVFTPPIHEVPCIYVSPKSISAGWRPLPPQTGARMERVFRPVVLMEASSAAIWTFFHITYAVTKAKVLDALGTESSRRKYPIYLPREPSQPTASSEAGPTDDSRSSKPVFPFFPDLGNGDAMRKMHADVVSSMPYSIAIQHAASAFNRVRNIRQRLAVSTNVRGICQVRGFITFFGERGRFRLEVIAYYLPADNVFVGAVNVKQGYIVQDYRAWDKLIENRKKQKAVDTSDNKTITTLTDTKPTTPPSAPPPTENDESEK